jgi:hypothetical protein
METGVRPGIVVKEKDVFHVQLCGCVVAVCLNVPCTVPDVLRSRAGSFTTLVYSVLLNVGKNVLKNVGDCGKITS